MTFLFIFLMLTLGYFLQKIPLNPVGWAKSLNTYVLWIALPALTFLHMPDLEWDLSLLFPASVAWVSFLAAWLWVLFLKKHLALDRATVGCLLLTCGLGNTSFVGFPLISWLYGPQALKTALIIDQPGSFLVLSTLGLIAGSMYIGQEVRFKELAWRMACFPPFICFVVAMGLNGLSYQWPEFLMHTWAALGATLTPAALIAVGLQLKWDGFDQLKSPLIWGLGFRLVLSPLLIVLLYGFGLGLEDELLGVCVLEAGMAPMITGSIVASSLGLNPPLASLMVSLGIASSLLSVPLWFWILQWF